eukprot:1476862-Prymnesium_polylepis.1
MRRTAVRWKRVKPLKFIPNQIKIVRAASRPATRPPAMPPISALSGHWTQPLSSRYMGTSPLQASQSAPICRAEPRITDSQLRQRCACTRGTARSGSRLGKRTELLAQYPRPISPAN